MSWFKKKKKKNMAIRVERHEVGKTIVEYTLKDGRKFTSIIYGTAHIHYGESKVRVVNSLFYARSTIKSLSSVEKTIVDDEKNITSSHLGEVIFAHIIQTLPHEVEVNVPYESEPDDKASGNL